MKKHPRELTYILTFHGLGKPVVELPPGEEKYWLDVAFFESILELVRSRPEVRITFDDSNASDFKIALPALLKRNLTASFFLVSDRIDKAGYLSAKEIWELASAGMMIGSHGTQHRKWATLGAKELDDELRISKCDLQRISGKEIGEAACPMGSYNRKVLHALKLNGYSRVYTSDQGPSDSTEWLAARNTIVRGHTLEHVRRMIESSPASIRGGVRNLKLLLKRWL
jgi:peptidoglycan/xylan/chitin deacetylase (PgdA/CDA1 family)